LAKIYEELGEPVSKETLRADIRNMESIYNVEFVESKKMEGIYTYKDRKFSAIGLNASELSKINEVLSVLLKFKGLKQFEWIDETVAAIRGKLNLRTNQENKEIISFDTNEYYTGANHVTDLFNAIDKRSILKIQYQDFKSPNPYELEIHPYYLKQFNARWFLLGNNPDRKEYPYILALDRILPNGIKITSNKFHDPKIDWKEYFSDIIGVTKNPGKPVKVSLLITDKLQADYIKTKPLHESQTPMRAAGSGYETSIKVIPNFELEKLLLSFGEKIKVLSPPELQEKMKNHAEALKALY